MRTMIYRIALVMGLVIATMLLAGCEEAPAPGAGANAAQPPLEGEWLIVEYLHPVTQYDETTGTGRIVDYIDIAEYVHMTLDLHDGKFLWTQDPPYERLRTISGTYELIGKKLRFQFVDNTGPRSEVEAESYRGLVFLVDYSVSDTTLKLDYLSWYNPESEEGGLSGVMVQATRMR